MTYQQARTDILLSANFQDHSIHKGSDVRAERSLFKFERLDR
jgi:hypothetical protein